MKQIAVALAIALAAAPAGARSPDSGATGVRRVALIVSASDGGNARARLRYASSDAQAVARVFHDLGGLDASDTVMLQDPTPASLRAFFGEMARRVGAASGATVQFIFYYSGHSDERGLLLGDQWLTYQELLRLLGTVPARVQIAILDSCASGAFTQFKGGRVRPPFLDGDPASVSGHAFLAATSEHEAAQESDRIRGSFFTYYLVTGLRGAADVDGDGNVTLDEAYRFAFDETLARTETSYGGAQHAAYDIKLTGSGGLVMTSMRRGSSELQIAPDIAGRIYVRDVRGRLVAELNKAAGGAPIRLDFAPGLYRATVDDGLRVWRAGLKLEPGRATVLEQSQLRLVAVEPTARRGPPDDGELDPTTDPLRYRLIPINIGIVPYGMINALARGRPVANLLSFDLLLGHSAYVSGADLSLGAAWVDEGVHGFQAAPLVTYLGGTLVGVQASLGFALTRGSVTGAQWAPVALTLGDFVGLQAGGFNVVRGDLGGVQLGVVNAVGDDAAALQGALLLNYGPRVSGVQLGPINVARELAGVQAGLFNVTRRRMRGIQIGVFNYADDADAAIGVLSISRRGGVRFDVWTSDVSAINVSLRLPARYTYSFVNVGVFPGGAGASWLYGIGAGGRVPLWQDRLHVEIDAAVYGVQLGLASVITPALMTQLRLMLSVRLARRLAIFGGGTYSWLFDSVDTANRPRPGYSYGGAVSPAHQRRWPGFVLGIEL